jgi:hypothetical protein
MPSTASSRIDEFGPERSREAKSRTLIENLQTITITDF